MFTSRFHIHFNCTVYSGSFTLKCVKFGVERPTRPFVLAKLNLTSLFIKANCSSTKFNFDWHVTREIRSFAFTRPECCISQFKRSSLRGLEGFVFLRAFTVYYTFWNVSSCKLAAVYRRFGDPISSMFRKGLSLLSPRSSEPLVKFYLIARRSIPENNDRFSNHFKEYKQAKSWNVYKCFFPAILISHSEEECMHNRR